MREYRVMVHGSGGSGPGQPIQAEDDADAREQAGQTAAYAPAGVWFKVFTPEGTVLGEYHRGGY